MRKKTDAKLSSKDEAMDRKEANTSINLKKGRKFLMFNELNN